MRHIIGVAVRSWYHTLKARPRVMSDGSRLTASTLAKMWGLLQPVEHRRSMVLLFMMMVGTGLETLGVGLVVPALALLTQSDYAAKFPAIKPLLQSLGNPDQKSLVAIGMLALIATYSVKATFLAFLSWWQARFAFGVQANLSERLFSLYMHQPYTFHLQRNSAELTQNVIGEVNMFNGTITYAVTLMTETLVMLSFFVLLLVVEPVGAMIVTAVLAFSACAYHRFTRDRVIRWGEERQYHEALRMQHLQQGLGGAKDVKLLGREAEFLTRYSTHNTETARVAHLQQTLIQLPRLWLELLAVLGLAALVFAMLYRGRPLDTILPTLGLFAAAAFRLLPSVGRTLTGMQSIKYGLPVINKLHAEMNLLLLHQDVKPAGQCVFTRKLELCSVSYWYPDTTTAALKDVSLSIGRGECVGFIGTSGAGKSTLVDVILGLLEPQNGNVRIDGQDIRSNMRSWQDQIGYVPQSIYLTDDSLRHNVAFGLSDAIIDDGAVRQAIRAARLDEFIATLPEGLDTMVGERGVRLSGGQRQRIGIARALYHDPVVLVLDEATSALDNDTEREVMDAVRALRGTKTIIIVAHRLSTVRDCDRIYRLEKGAVVEQGIYEQVVNP